MPRVPVKGTAGNRDFFTNSYKKRKFLIDLALLFGYNNSV